MKQEFIELYNFPKARLISHLNLEENDRLILSGKYGIGKTSFLKHFFEDDIQEQIINNGDNYDKKLVSINLFPVNYSVASNEDIFRYIKFDILHSLLNTNLLSVERPDISKVETSTSFIQQHILDILEITPLIGKSVIGTQKEVWKLYNKFLEYHKEVTTTDGDAALDFMKNIINSESTLYEDNFITRIISDFIDQIRDDNNVELILVIDDLDRVDPNHIFRLFNVFSAHFDTPSDKKIKFGFDKVMLVCDINNIRNIFNNRYGENVDFSGYIDKFYSKEIFEFDNSETIKAILYKILNSINLKGHNPEHDRILINKNGFISLLSILLEDLIRLKQINLRTLFKYYKTTLDLSENKTIRFGKNSIQNWQSDIIVTLDFMIKFLGEKRQLIELITKLSDNNSIPLEKYVHFYEEVILLLDSNNHQFSLSDTSYKFNQDGWMISYKLLRQHRDDSYYCRSIQFDHIGSPDKNIFYQCLKTIKLLENVNYY